MPASLELLCLHECGHVAAALALGSVVTEVSMQIGERVWGRTRIVNVSNYQRRMIATAGYAIERNLFEEGRLLNGARQQITETEFQRATRENCFHDRLFYGELVGNFLTPLSFEVAAALLKGTLDVALVEILAVALFNEGRLTTARISQLVKDDRDARQVSLPFEDGRKFAASDPSLSLCGASEHLASEVQQSIFSFGAVATGRSAIAGLKMGPTPLGQRSGQKRWWIGS